MQFVSEIFYFRIWICDCESDNMYTCWKQNSKANFSYIDAKWGQVLIFITMESSFELRLRNKVKFRSSLNEAKFDQSQV